MLLGPAALRRRLPLIVTFVLASMLLGAGLAALQTPTFRSTATVSGPADLASIVRSGDVAQEFRSRVAAAYGDQLASSAVAFASESGQRVELATESQFAGTAEDLTRFYTESVMTIRPDVALDEPASFPVSASAPNLRRTALISFVIGASLGWAVAVVVERRSPTSLTLAPSTTTTPSSPDTAPMRDEAARDEPARDESRASMRSPESEPHGSKHERPAAVTHTPRIDQAELPRARSDRPSPRSPKIASEVPRVVKLPDQT